MAQKTSETMQRVDNLISAGFIKEDDLLSFVNQKLGEEGLALTGTPSSTRKRKAKPTHERAETTQRVRKEYEDGRTNHHAILLAVSMFGEDGCQSAELREKLEEIGHPMETGVFHTTRSNLQNKDKMLKSSGKNRHKTYKLTVAGSDYLEQLENPETDDPDESETSDEEE